MSSRSFYQCHQDEFWRRELGILSPRAYARRKGGSEDLIRRFRIHNHLEGHHGCVNTVSFTPDGTALISGSDDRTIKIWDWSKGVPLLSYHSGHRNNVFQARAMPHSDNNVIVSCAADGQVRCGTISEGMRVEGTRELARHSGRAHKLALEAGNPNCFLSCGEDGVVFRFDLREAVPSSRLFACHSLSPPCRSHETGLNSIAINPRRPDLFAVGGSDSYARVYDLRCCSNGGETEALVDTFCPNHLAASSEVHITCLAYSEQEEVLVSYNDELIYLFQKHMGLGPTPTTAASTGLSGGGDERGEGGGAAVEKAKGKLEERVETDGGMGAAQVYRGHRNAQTVKGVSFFGARSEYVVSGSDCGGVFFWKKVGGEVVARMEGDSAVVNCLEPHPTTTLLATSGIDSDIKLWTPTADRPSQLSHESKQIMERNERNRERVSHRLFTRIPSPHHMILRTLQDLRRAEGDHEAEEILIPYEGLDSDSSDEESEDEDDDDVDEVGGDVANNGGVEGGSGEECVEEGEEEGEGEGGSRQRRRTRRLRDARPSECHVQ